METCDCPCANSQRFLIGHRKAVPAAVPTRCPLRCPMRCPIRNYRRFCNNTLFNIQWTSYLINSKFEKTSAIPYWAPHWAPQRAPRGHRSGHPIAVPNKELLKVSHAQPCGTPEPCLTGQDRARQTAVSCLSVRSVCPSGLCVCLV